MRKFQRSYRVTIDLGEGIEPIIIGMPLTAQFSIQRRLLSSLNVLNLDLYNLSPKVRDLIFQEFFGTERRKSVKIEAGYDTLSTLFEGDIFEAYSFRSNTEIITSIHSKSGTWDVDNKKIYQAINADGNQKSSDIIEFLIGQFDFIEKGAVGGFDTKIQRPVILNGHVYDEIKKYSNNKVFIDNNRIYVLKDNEVIDGELVVIDKNTGILDTPRRQGGFLQVRTLFEPRLVIGQKAVLKSDIAPIYNGDYKVVGLQHQGMISEAVGGKLSTMVDLFVGNQTFKTVVNG